jgi:urea transport system substrate-binding protein
VQIMIVKEPATWRVGVLFSRSGVSSITESEHFFGTALAIEEINASGGVQGRQIAPVAYDPGGDNSAYRALARELLTEDELSVIFGCSTSASRKAVLPIVERHNGLLLYPSMYEGFEYSENVIYTGATLNQNTFALADFLLQRYGRRIYLVGADYLYPRESNRVMRDLIESKGGEVVAERYIPLDAGTSQLTELVEEISRLAPDAVFSTIIGTTAREFYTLYDTHGIDRKTCPIASLTMAESEIGSIGWERCTGHILAASYFESIDNDVNRTFVDAYKARFGPEAHTSVWSQPAYAQVHMFARALERVGSMDCSKLAAAMMQEEMDAPEGKLFFDEDTRHIWVTPRIGVLGQGGLFDIVWEAPAPVRPDPYLVTSRFDETWLDAQ